MRSDPESSWRCQGAITTTSSGSSKTRSAADRPSAPVDIWSQPVPGPLAPLYRLFIIYTNVLIIPRARPSPFLPLMKSRPLSRRHSRRERERREEKGRFFRHSFASILDNYVLDRINDRRRPDDLHAHYYPSLSHRSQLFNWFGRTWTIRGCRRNGTLDDNWILRFDIWIFLGILLFSL